MRTIITAFLAIFLLLANQAFTADQPTFVVQGDREGQQAIFIHFERGRLTVALREAPIKAVLEEIGHRTGIEIVFLDSIRQNISLEFENLPLEEGVRRLLKNYGLSLVTAGADSNPLEKVFVVEGGGSVRPGRRHVSPPPWRDQKARQQRSRADQRAHAFASMLDKEQIKQYLEAFVKNPYTMPDLSLFADAVKAVSAEELEPIIQMLEDENVPLSEYKATLKPLKDVMGPLARGSVIGHMQNSGVRKNVLDQLKVIHKYKMRQKAKKK
jgi:type II secretory pathway component GspD/PulD (secretin)